MEEHDKTNDWSDGWHTRANTGDSLRVLRDAAIGVANSAVKTVTTGAPDRESKPDGWSDGSHANASPRNSLSELRDSVCDTAKSTVKTATTREGWWKIARGTGKVIGGGVTVAAVVAHGMMQAAADSSPDHLKHGLLENDLIENDLLENDLIENGSIGGDRTYL
ncbi:hypothetical protein [Halomonas colorata]|uniref:hypothetical protein n=1 Tax=Halomonas colorata TaxID=2742615 RepID=UPI0018671AE5|nr:hypothetical protein [Halomonas colorata]